MSALTRWIIQHEDSGWQAEIDIDMEQASAPCLESLNFFGDPIEREDESPEEIVRAFLSFWTPVLCFWSIVNRGCLSRIVSETTEYEGLFPLDGSCGITLVHCDQWEWDRSDFTITQGKQRKEAK